MKKRFKNLAKYIFSVCIALAFAISVGFVSEKTVASADGYTLSLASGTHEKWIDRLDLSSAQYARDFYDWLVESSDNDGVEDHLIDVTKQEHQIVEIRQTFSTEGFGSHSLIDAEGKRRAVENFNEVADYSSMVFAAFNRDYNEVFWLNREIRTSSEYTLTYVSSTEVELVQNVYMVLKNDSLNPSERFDVRLSAYVNGSLDIREEIARVNQAIESILSGVREDATRYEMVKYFNKYLTENNCYAKDIGENSRDCRGALLGQNGNSKYAPVCEGYARAFKVLCDRVGIPCVLSNGTGNTEEHMWNLVKMEDDKWYGVDVTWNDPSVMLNYDKVSGAENEDYLLVGANTVLDGKKFSQSHVETNYLYSDNIPLNNGPTLAQEEYKITTREEEWDVSKTAGVDNVTASLFKTEGSVNYKLVISGTGAMVNYARASDCPWASYAFLITEIEIKEGVTEILGEAFKGCYYLDKLTILSDLNCDSDLFYNGFSLEIYCHQGYDVYNFLTSSGYSVNSICEIEDWSVKIHQSCLEDEVLVGACAICGHEEEKVTATKLGHNYLDWQIIVEPTETQVGLAEKVCERDPSHVETCELPILDTVNYAYSVIDNPTCEENGKEAYVYTYNEEEIVVFVQINSLGHDYKTPIYEWNSDYSQCTAKTECKNDSEHVIIEIVKSAADRQITCDYEGNVTYTASFKNALFELQTVTLYKTATDHDYSQELQKDKTSHWHQCKNCSARKDVESHKFGSWETEEEAGIFLVGEKSRACDCGYVEYEIIPKQEFFTALSNGTLTTLDKFIVIGGGSLIGLFVLVILIKIIFRRRNY